MNPSPGAGGTETSFLFHMVKAYVASAPQTHAARPSLTNLHTSTTHTQRGPGNRTASGPPRGGLSAFMGRALPLVSDAQNCSR